MMRPSDTKENADVSILVVEDSRTQAEQLRHVLEENNYSVWMAQNGKEALDILHQKKPTMVLSDIMMPEMDGYELCRQMRALPDLANIPTILLTSLSDPLDVIKGLECGANNFVTKPYDEQYLLSRIQYILINMQLRKNEKTQVGVEIFFAGKRHFITSERQQILDLLLSTYETAIQKNYALAAIQAELKGVNQLLQEKNEELDEFAHIVAHDLKAPLRGITTLADLLAGDYSNKLDANGKQTLDTMVGSVKRMHRLIDSVLSYSRIGRMKATKTKIDPELLLQEILRSLSLPKHIEVKVQRELPTLFYEPASLEQVFQNLLSNAVKFMDKSKGEIVIGCAEEEAFWKFNISDNGPGIERKYFSKIFKIFQTLGKPSLSDSTGIGLTVVKKIVETFGGKIWVESELEKGTTFYFTIPK